MRVPIFVANWKMNKTNPEAQDFFRKFLPLIRDFNKAEVIIVPSFVALQPISEQVSGSNVSLAAQNIFYEDEGTFTGEVSVLMIKPFCEYVILGHSERRTYFNETNEIINKKT